MSILRIAVLGWFAIVLGALPRAQPLFSDGQAIIEFQRALDAYAFQHRQVQRRLGTSADQQAMAAGMRAARPSPQDGGIFTPLVAAAFRARIGVAFKSGACRLPEFDRDNFVVPRPNDSAVGAGAIPACVTAVLPRLPEELEYRHAGVALALVDTHANLVVDVLHAAFPQPAVP